VSARDLFSDETPAPAAASSTQTCGSCANGTITVGSFVRCSFGPRWKLYSQRQACDFNPTQFVSLNAAAIARRAAQAGIDQAAAGADREISGWSTTAFEFIRSYAIAHRGQQYIGHDIVQASIAAGVVQPSNPKAWGAPIQRAAREGVIVRVGYSPDPNRHTNPVPLWATAAA
jgi:hypothetical protein